MTSVDLFTGRSLQAFNTLAVPCMAAHYLWVSSREQLIVALQRAQREQLQVLVLGGGSNVVLPETFDGLVIHIGIRGFEVVREDDDHLWLRAGAGEIWQDLVEYCLEHNYFGLENLSLIPGTVGAAPIQNIGAYGVELESVFAELTAVDRQSQQEVVFDRAACEFNYRDSAFKHQLKDRYVITSVTFKLGKSPQLNISYAPLQDALEQAPREELTARMVSEAVCMIRRSKLPDPTQIPNAGSFFKNPIISREQFDALAARYPDIASYPVDAARVKIAAAWLLDKAGWRGKSEGGLGMHSKQALVLVNPGRCCGQQVLDYAAKIQQDILHRFGIELEREPVAY
ncbi:UDP-N-acetylmuramate dehydrogenase [Proteobacteria bacterium 005FR1]|nr:UDP-N-acetylmuramate dehydrogenase [Proteobacteria bacterium 005FR1]